MMVTNVQSFQMNISHMMQQWKATERPALDLFLVSVEFCWTQQEIVTLGCILNFFILLYAFLMAYSNVA